MKHYLTDLRSKLANKKKDNKGFTLVELIVVIVILAILAALLVPALVGWIDKAKESNYTVEARSVYLATQAYVSESYGTNNTLPTGDLTDAAIAEIKALSGVNVSKVTIDSYFSDVSSGNGRGNIKSMTTEFKSSDNKDVKMTLNQNKWTKG